MRPLTTHLIMRQIQASEFGKRWRKLVLVIGQRFVYGGVDLFRRQRHRRRRQLIVALVRTVTGRQVGRRRLGA